MLYGKTLRILPTLAAVFCLGLSALYAAPASKITVSAPDRDYSDCPVTVDVKAPAGAKSAVLTDGKSGKTLPAQVTRDGSAATLTWILPQLKRGASIDYAVKFSDSAAPGAGVALKKGDDGVDINIGGKLFTRYLVKGAAKPICYPIIGPTGVNVTRNYPIKEVEGESHDHPHQRSHWFTHGDVNGTSYWHVGRDTGKQIHRAYQAVESGPVMGRIRSVNDWVKKNGMKDCEDVRELRVYNVANGRMFDWDITVRATEGPVKFGDTKEGSFGFRVATSMRIRTPDKKKGKGTLTNSEGQIDNDTWGKAAKWCDYSGPIEGKTIGITIMDHPKSFRHPTYWHVRDYGLFAANPFGLHDFNKIRDKRPGDHTIPEGGSTTFRYRCWIHNGSAEDANVAGVYEQFANPPKVVVK